MKVRISSTHPGFNEALQKARVESYAHIMAHEQAHQSAAGQYGGGIHIDYNSQGIAIAGHVPVHVPALDVFNPSASIQAGQTIKNAALAPSDPSSADKGVAALAQRLMSKAQEILSKGMNKLGADLFK